MRQFDLKAEAEMRLQSEKFAAELARKRRESPAGAGGSAPTPASAEPTGTATATDVTAETE
ncbi:hypothetical protein ACGFOU_02115 [Streptomyces sp. NPDC048595]|uniref:hypothetical protein n=1 Tax=Streptomyces sp. NPDC048595 TaxID=3365576 RepID=UPI003714A508